MGISEKKNKGENKSISERICFLASQTNRVLRELFPEWEFEGETLINKKFIFCVDKVVLRLSDPEDNRYWYQRKAQVF